MPYRPSDPESLYSLLLKDRRAASLGVGLGMDGGLPITLNLVGKFDGKRTGSTKADAYLWAKETFLDTGEVTGDELGYEKDCAMWCIVRTYEYEYIDVNVSECVCVCVCVCVWVGGFLSYLYLQGLCC